MKYLFENVFYHKQSKIDEFMNATYWIFLMSKNILKWLYIIYMILERENYPYKYLLIAILLLTPILKFSLIGIGNIYKFRKNFRRHAFTFIIFLIVFLESSIELPIHFILPKNYVYLNSNYYKIYDTMKYRHIEILSEMIENLIVLIFIFIDFLNGIIGVFNILCFSISGSVWIYFILAEIYYSLIYEEKAGHQQLENTDKNNRRYTKIPKPHTDIKELNLMYRNEERKEIELSHIDFIKDPMSSSKRSTTNLHN